MEVSEKEQKIITDEAKETVVPTIESLRIKMEETTESRLANKRKAIITISGIDHNIIINDGNFFHGYKSDYMLIGKIFENKHIIYILDGDKYNSYLTQGDETIEIYIDGTIGHLGKNTVNIEEKDVSIEEIASDHLDFLNIYMDYMRTNLPTLITVLEEIDQLTHSTKENPEQLYFDEVFKKYKENIIKLKKQYK